MARPNYSSVKRAKELKRKAKREAKMARKLARRATSDPAPPLDTAAAMASRGGRCVPLAADVADRAQVGAMIAEAVERCGGVDILVANAGIGFPDPILEITDDNWYRVLGVNLKGAFL